MQSSVCLLAAGCCDLLRQSEWVLPCIRNIGAAYGRGAGHDADAGGMEIAYDDEEEGSPIGGILYGRLVSTGDLLRFFSPHV